MTTDFPAVCARTSRQLHLSKLAHLPESEWRKILDTEERSARDRLAYIADTLRLAFISLAIRLEYWQEGELHRVCWPGIRLRRSTSGQGQRRTRKVQDESPFVRLLDLRKPTNVLALSELTWFSAQTLRCPQVVSSRANGSR